MKRHRTRLQVQGEVRELLSSLPPDILTNILSRLPFTAILRFKLVCKTWLHLLSSPYFSRLHSSHRSHRPPCLFLYTGPFCRTQIPREFYLLDINLNSNRRTYDSTVTSLDTKFNLPTSLGKVVGSCNGLLCLFHEDTNSICVCNPLTGEYVKLPEHRQCYPGEVFGFWFSSLSDQFKVFARFCKSGKLVVFTSGIGNGWRDIGHLPKPALHCYSVPLNGALHWVTEDGDDGSRYSLCCLDVESEKVETFSCPPCGLAELVVLGDLLCLYKYVHKDHYDCTEIWVMEKYGVGESWTKRYVCPLSLPLRMEEDGNLLLVVSENGNYCLAYYDPRTQKKTRKIKVRGLPQMFNVVPHHASFFPINMKNVMNVYNHRKKRLQWGAFGWQNQEGK